MPPTEEKPQSEFIGILYPSGLSATGAFDIVAARFSEGVLVADTTSDRKIVCGPSSPWVFVSAPGQQDKIDFQ